MLSTGSNLGTSSTNYVAPALVPSASAEAGQGRALDAGNASVPKELPRSYGQPAGTSDTQVRPERTAALSAQLFAELWADAQTRAGASAADSIRQPYPLAERLQALAKENGATPAEIAVTLQILSDGAAEFAATAVHAMAQGAVGAPGAPQDAAPLDARTLTALVQVAVNTARSSFFPQSVYTPPPASTTADGAPAARWDVVATLTGRTVHAAWTGMAAGLRIAADAASPEEARHVLAATLRELIGTAVDQSVGEYDVSAQERTAAAQAIQDLLPMLAEQLDTVAANNGVAALSQGVAGQVLADAVRSSALFAASANTGTAQRGAADTARVEVQHMAQETDVFNDMFDIAQAVMPITASWNNSFTAAGGKLPDAQTLLAPLLAARNGPPPLDAAAMRKLGEALTARLPGIVDGLVEAMTGGSGNMPADERARVQEAVTARTNMALQLAGAQPTPPQQWTGLLAATDLAQQIRGIVTRSGETGLRALFAVGHLAERLKGVAATAAAQVAPDDAAGRAQLLAGLRADSTTLVDNVMAQLPDSLLTPAQRARLQNTLAAEISLLPATFTPSSDPDQALLQDLQLAAGKALQPLMQSPETLTPDKVAQTLQPVLAALLAKLSPATTTDDQMARAQLLQAVSSQLGAMAKQLASRLMLDMPATQATGVGPAAGLGPAIVSAVLSQGIENATRTAVAAVTPQIPPFLLNASTRQMIEQLVDLYGKGVAYGMAGPSLDAFVRQQIQLRGDQFAGPEWRASNDPKAVLLSNYEAVADYVALTVTDQQKLNPKYAAEVRQSLAVTLGYAAESATQKNPDQFRIAANVWALMQDAVRSGDAAQLQELMRMGSLQPVLKGVHSGMSEIEGPLRAMLAHLPVSEDTRTALMQTLQAERRIAPAWQALPDTTAGQFIKTLAPQLVDALRAGLVRDASGQWTLGEEGLAALKQQVAQGLTGFKNYRDDLVPGILKEVESQIPRLLDMVLTYVNASRPIAPDERDRLSNALAGGAQEALNAVRKDVRASAAANALASHSREDVFYWIQSLLMDARDIMARQYQGLTTDMQATTQKMGLHQRIIEGLNELISFTAEDATSDAEIPYGDKTDSKDNPRNYYKRAREILVDMWTSYNQIGEGPALDGHTAYWNEQNTIPVAMVRADDPRVKEAGTVILNDLLLDKMRASTPEQERLVHAALFVGSGVTLGAFPLSIMNGGGYATLDGVKMGIAQGYVFIQDRALYEQVLNDPRTMQDDKSRDGHEVLGLNFPVSVGHYQAFTREKATNTMQVFTSKVDQMGREQSIAATGVTNASNMMSASLDAVRKIVKDMSDWIDSIIVGMR